MGAAYSPTLPFIYAAVYHKCLDIFVDACILIHFLYINQSYNKTHHISRERFFFCTLLEIIIICLNTIVVHLF